MEKRNQGGVSQLSRAISHIKKRERGGEKFSPIISPLTKIATFGHLLSHEEGTRQECLCNLRINFISREKTFIEAT